MKQRLCSLGLAALAATSSGWAGAKPLPPKGNCAVCGMYVANFPDWAAAVVFKDGTQAWFDGPKDLFNYLLDLKHYAAKRREADIETILVKDYYALKHIDARKAFFVLRSDVLGPMGQELVPFATEADAKGFLKDHRGQRILRFPEVTQAALKSLD